ncbi:DUF2306 domain-containing protein [Bacillus salipaludis]|uniref:DUF2306 domain-containing protein n=1 Tax=Bacillus salipaludis TaxID=2547811 RepID=A0A4R5VLS2_9BACI|nr:DUF2306 domain-containing protein [Bacillus salipaludis]TDK58816.1 DUF2306 domain-containing protein [Bacillus salipaludis]
MKNTKKGILQTGLLYSIIFLFTLYIFFMFLNNGVEQAPIVKAKLKNHDFSLSTWKWFFYPHIVLGIISLALGPLQLTMKSGKNIKLHKRLGYLYAGSIFLNILVVPYLSLFATGGRGSTIAFLVLDVCWLWTTSFGGMRAVQRKVQEHKLWMLRSYAITWVFVTFRIVLILLSIFLNHSISFPIAVYLSIMINLGIMEWRRNRKSKGIKKLTSINPV